MAARWIEEEYARATDRLSRVPDYARWVWTRTPLGSAPAEQLTDGPANPGPTVNGTAPPF